MTNLDKCVLPKRLKLDKGFRPCVVQAGEEVYPNGVFEFNVTRLVAFIQEQADRIPVEPVELSELPNYGESPSLNEEVVRSADLSRIAELRIIAAKLISPQS
jgi:hypothetical protein